jgi:hypothetical protein
MMNGSKGCGMTYINGIKGGLVANVGMYESPQFTTDELLKIVTSKDIEAGEELLVDYGSEYVLGDSSVAALLNAAAVVADADAKAADVSAAAAAGGESTDVPAHTATAERTSGDGPHDPAAPGHGTTDTSGDGASAHGNVSTGHDHDAGASQTQDSAEGTTHCSVTSTGFLTLTRYL